MRFHPVYQDEDGWFRFIVEDYGVTKRSGEYAHRINAESDRDYIMHLALSVQRQVVGHYDNFNWK